MVWTARARLTEVRVHAATAGDAKHGRQLLDGLGSNGLYLHVTAAGAKCRVQQLMAPNAATGKSRRVRIGFGAPGPGHARRDPHGGVREPAPARRWPPPARRRFMDLTAAAYIAGGRTGIFTPLYCFLARKPS